MLCMHGIPNGAHEGCRQQRLPFVAPPGALWRAHDSHDYGRQRGYINEVGDEVFLPDTLIRVIQREALDARA